jgi:hypothetical protein
MANTVSNVSAGKPNPAGALYWAPLGTTLPTDATAALDDAFLPLGYVSEDGLTNSNTRDNDEIHAWGGDAVLNLESNYSDTFQFTLLEILNVNVLKMVYGDDNVSGTLETGITVKANSAERTAGVFVAEMALRDGAKQRIICPNAKLTELGDITYVDNDAAGYECTLSAMPGGFAAGDNDTHKTYIKRAA